MSLLEGELAEIIGDALEAADLPYPVKLVRVVPGEVDPETPWIEPEDDLVEFDCMGWVEEYSDYRMANAMVQANDRKVMVTATSLSTTPKVGGLLVAQGRTYSVTEIGTDPATAAWELKGRL